MRAFLYTVILRPVLLFRKIWILPGHLMHDTKQDDLAVASCESRKC